MACCGKTRKQFNKPVPASEARGPLRGPLTARSQTVPRRATVYFEYIGKTGLTVFGAVTGKRYRFDGNGAVVAVDLCDKPSMASVPNVRQVRNP